MTEKLAGQLAVGINSPMRIYLSGDLGGGKTLWTRALLRAFGRNRRVPSPVFALAFSYQTSSGRVHHLDYSANRGICRRIWPNWWTMTPLAWVEWPERAGDLPMPDLFLRFDFVGEQSRRITLTGKREKGNACLSILR